MTSSHVLAGTSSGRFLTKLTVIATLGGLLFGYNTHGGVRRVRAPYRMTMSANSSTESPDNI